MKIIKRSLTDKQKNAKAAASVGKKRVAIEKERQAAEDAAAPAEEKENAPKELNTDNLVVYRDPHGRPAIFLSQERKFVHLVGRREDNTIGPIRIPAITFQTSGFKPLFKNNEPYSPVRAAKFWLKLPVDNDRLSPKTRRVLEQVAGDVDGEVEVEPEGDVIQPQPERRTTMNTKKATKKSAVVKPAAVKASNGNGASKTAKTETTDNRKIKLLVKENPKRDGSEAHKRFELYKKSATVEAFLKNGGLRADINWDTKQKFIALSA